MTTDRRPPRGEEGFTLIEVLFAMLILAVGLLGLEALGIGASQAVTRAQKQSRFAVVASDTLERTLSRIRRDESPADGTYAGTVGASGREDTLRVEVLTELVGTGPTPLRSVRVTVVPYPGSAVLSRSDSLTVTGYVYN